MQQSNNISTYKNPVAVLVISPDGHFYEQSSLRQCAVFFSELRSRLTGESQAYFDHTSIRAKLRFEDGEFSGLLAGWRVKEFPSLTSLRSYVWDKNGVPSKPSSRRTA